jgi:hypothetical protein
VQDKKQQATDMGYSSPDLYSDANGRGAVLGTLQTNDASMQNKASLRPGGMAAGVPMQAQPQMGEVDDEEAMAANEQLQVDISDTLNALFEGSNATPEFVEKIKTVFTAALNEKVSLIEQSILEASKEIIEEKLQESVGQVVEHVDQYLSYVVEEWAKENQLAIENGFRTEIAENFILGLKELFENSFIDVPQEKYDILDDLFSANAELEKAANTAISENMQLRNEVLAHKCAESFIEISDGLADTEVEKLAKLSESLEFDSVEQYAEKVQILKESYFGSKANQQAFAPNYGSITEETTNTNTKPTGSDPLMEQYVRSISNQLKLTNTPKK